MAEQYGFMAYDGKFTGGVFVATGDVDGDGKQEIVTGAGYGGGPQVSIFKNGQPEKSFFAYDPKLNSGVRVACADVDGDGKDEIITVPGPGGGPHVKVWDYEAL